MIDIKDKNGLVIEVGMIVKMKDQDIEDGVVCGFDGDRVDGCGVWEEAIH